jgi:hypothetical protein
MEALSLAEAIAWVLSGGGAGVIAFFLVGKVKALRSLEPDYKRYASIGIAVVLALLAWGAGMGMGYLAVPIDWRGWIEAAFATIALAYVTSQTVHGVTDLRQRRIAAE